MSPISAAKPSSRSRPTEIPMLIGGEWRAAAETYAVRDPYRNTVVANAPRSALTDLDDALDAAVKAKAKAAATPAYERAALLRRAATLLVERADRIAEIMSRETGKAIKDAKAEIIRSQDTLSLVGRRGRAHRGRAYPARRQRHGRRKNLFHAALSGRRGGGDNAVQRAGEPRLPQDRAVDRGRKYPGAEGAAAIAGRDPRAGADLRRGRHARRRAQRALWRHRRPGAGPRSPRRFHHLYRLAARRRADQGGIGLAPGRARTGRQRRHHRPRGRRHRRGRAGLRPQLDAARRPKLHLGADRLCPPQPLRANSSTSSSPR